jgi:pimeloyl-ACP methyl ester carboxylesterase
MPYRQKWIRSAHPGGYHRMVYSDWGAPDAPRTLVCVHGLTRSGRDFDRLAGALSGPDLRILAPDIVGRGRSDWMGPGGVYDIQQYVVDLLIMLEREDAKDVDWLGTSMGGLIGMVMGGRGGPIRRMAINDVGPFIPKAALERIGEYVGVPWRFESFDQGVEHVKRAYEPFGLTNETDWRYLAELSLSRDADGFWTNAYDPRIAEPFKAPDIDDADLWGMWDAIDCPVWVLRGAESDLLLPDTAREMETRGPRARITEVPGCGHAPALMDETQIALVRDWLYGG